MQEVESKAFAKFKERSCENGLTETALAFCCGCLGWAIEIKEFPNGYHLIYRDGHPWAYDSLNSVIAEAVWWCNTNGLSFSLEYEAPDFHASVSRIIIEPEESAAWAEKDYLGYADRPTPSHALMAACVKAHKKLSEGK